MSNEFLQSSPSHSAIDPIMYSFVNAGHEKENNNANQPSNVQNNGNNNYQPNPQIPPSSVTKVYGGPTNLTGWTPLITRPVYSEQLIPFGLTPNKVGAIGDQPDYSQGLNLTPFLNHNINLLNSQPGLQLHSITPFHDKTLHLTDFFMDSPIRQTPVKDLDTITPSKFKLGSEKKYFKQSIFQDRKSANKRSITQLGTPQRQPRKISVNYKPTGEDEEEDDDRDQDEGSERNDENQDRDIENDIAQSRAKLYLQTPSKTLKNVTNLTRTPISSTDAPGAFITPAKQIPNSSPSTVILSAKERSAVRVTKELEKQPTSPTPTKAIRVAPCKKLIQGDEFKPAMGVFSERKQNHNKTSGSFKSFVNLGSNESNQHHNKTKTNSKAQMQAGMNKFQIVFTDVHTLMNNKNRSKEYLPTGKKASRSGSEQLEAKSDKKKGLPRSSTLPVSQKDSPISHNQQPLLQPVMYHQVAQHTTSMLSNQDHNSTMNTSKEISVISGSSSNLNSSSNTDHSSFELGGISSTPNGTFFSDKMFEKPSPQSMNPSTQFYIQNQFNSMPPPRQHAFLQYQQNQSMMMMSTPQHHNIVTCGPNMYQPQNDSSPNDSTSNLSVFSYHKMHNNGTPQGKLK
ncbi:uncharacterized protein PRCAT00005725001 [Priceomyces carsonii]|uniref:uncharacterized protein n=1 Tax=Priceomyces carsonii TaxID=28549 RepID=UPI002EDA9AEC|nr:unnamed protein product [Priceomyces carsonii]